MALPHDMLRYPAQASAVLSPFDHSKVDSLGQATPPCLKNHDFAPWQSGVNMGKLGILWNGEKPHEPYWYVLVLSNSFAVLDLLGTYTSPIRGL